jgi:hypothetical protein
MAPDILSIMKTMCRLVRGESSRSASWLGVIMGNLHREWDGLPPLYYKTRKFGKVA